MIDGYTYLKNVEKPLAVVYINCFLSDAYNLRKEMMCQWCMREAKEG
jgi:hypothetical protein